MISPFGSGAKSLWRSGPFGHARQLSPQCGKEKLSFRSVAPCVCQPIATFTDKIALTGARDRIARKSYIRAKSYANPGFDRAQSALKSDSSWRSYDVPSGHDVMVDMPDRLSEILLEVAG
jgi:hypothetical protein